VSGVRLIDGRRLALAVALLAAFSVSAAAQSVTPGPPGPFVFDIRGATSGVPNDAAFVPPSLGVAAVPTRGFGGGIGGHVYAFEVGPGRLGLGVDVMFTRGTTPDVTTTFSAIDPQLSLNFGTENGWSYLSAGVGPARVEVQPVGLSETVRAINWGGGARWFLNPHFGVGFDVRVRTLAAGDVVPKGSSLSAAVGLSLK
jgi:hypothetical protein